MKTISCAGSAKGKVFMSDCSTKSGEHTYPIRVGNRLVGVVSGGKFRKRIKFSKHALRTPPALALSVESLRRAVEVSADGIEITDKESGRVYSCSLEHFNRYSWPTQRGGFEPQRALALDRWTVSMSGAVGPSGSTSTPAPVYSEPTVTHSAGPVQLSFM